LSKNNQKMVKTALRQKAILIISGFLLTLAILEAGLRLGGFILTSLQERRNRISIQQKGTYRIMCLGESTTAGQYPSFLEEVLNSRKTGIKFSVINEGIRATNTSLILAMLESNLDVYHPDMVITMMGINDQGPHMPYEPVSDSNAISFLRSFRTYKLTRLLWLHIVTKLKEVELRKHMLLSGKASKFKREIALNPRNDAGYLALARFCRDQGQLSEADEFLKKAIEISPRNSGVYVGLVRFYRNQGKLSEAEESFKKAIALNPGNVTAYVGLAWFYKSQGKLSEAEESLKKAIALNPGNSEAYVGLARFYRYQGRFLEAEESFKKAIALNPGNDKLCTELGILYEKMGNPGLAREYAKKARELGLNYYNPVTINNYRKLKAILDKRGIVYVCVQYPMRTLEPLKKIFEGEEGIVFVDNEIVFKRKLRNAKYEDYFRDNFGGDFGHCTSKGNRLLAENIANTMLKEVFHK
jgi:tetratricopeptide (TPR) repeat protein